MIVNHLIHKIFKNNNKNRGFVICDENNMFISYKYTMYSLFRKIHQLKDDKIFNIIRKRLYIIILLYKYNIYELKPLNHNLHAII